jgi:metal-responsive CopG/Arc/MetJ family transcriptional regulator
MRTTIDIPEHLLDEVQRTTEASTRKEAILIALEDYVSRHRLRRIIEAAGTLDFDTTTERSRTSSH